jgi:Arc/MetJ-type ribon-helix-helix transcriptional regulator
MDGPQKAGVNAAMNINLKPEQEQIIQAEIESGHFRSPDEVLDHALAALQEKDHKRKSATPRKNLAQFLMESPLAGAELNLERQKDYGPPLSYEWIPARYECTFRVQSTSRTRPAGETVA